MQRVHTHTHTTNDRLDGSNVRSELRQTGCGGNNMNASTQSLYTQRCSCRSTHTTQSVAAGVECWVHVQSPFGDTRMPLCSLKKCSPIPLPTLLTHMKSQSTTVVYTDRYTRPLARAVGTSSASLHTFENKNTLYTRKHRTHTHSTFDWHTHLLVQPEMTLPFESSTPRAGHKPAAPGAIGDATARTKTLPAPQAHNALSKGGRYTHSLTSGVQLQPAS